MRRLTFDMLANLIDTFPAELHMLWSVCKGIYGRSTGCNMRLWLPIQPIIDLHVTWDSGKWCHTACCIVNFCTFLGIRYDTFSLQCSSCRGPWDTHIQVCVQYTDDRISLHGGQSIVDEEGKNVCLLKWRILNILSSTNKLSWLERAASSCILAKSLQQMCVCTGRCSLNPDLQKLKHCHKQLTLWQHKGSHNDASYA